MKWLLLCGLCLASAGCEAVGGDPDAVVDMAAPPPDVRVDLDATRGDTGTRDDLGDPCESNEDCRSGFCVLVRGMERVCTRKCGNDDDCPEDWICRQVTNSGADVTFICVPEDAPCAGADLQTDPAHCGDCDTACEYPGATAECAAGQCRMGPCDEGFHDLDGDPANGCEYPCTETRDGDEACDEIDNDCDGATDEGIDTRTSLEHCGRCGARCTPPNAVGACVEGACTVESCLGDFSDADGDPDNGCEAGCRETNGGNEACDNIDNDCDDAVDEGVDLQVDPANCGACGVRCDRANAITGCEAGECTWGGCQDGFFDRNEDPADGCEVACQRSNGGVEACDEIDNDCDFEIDEGIDLLSNPIHCGRCGKRCDRPNAITACVEGACTFDGCLDGFRDANDDPEDGCETGCVQSNGGVERCDQVDNDCDGRVDEGLDQGEEVCNGQDDDCDGQVDETFDLQGDPSNCGQCGRVCRFNNAAALCSEGDCAIGACDDGWVNLDGAAGNGCEYACAITFEGVEICDQPDNDCDGEADEGIDLLNDRNHCGACNRRCELAHADAACVQANCRIAECEMGFVDADRMPGTGCECEQSNAGVEACDGDDNDCDNLVDEAFDLQNDRLNCGECGHDCTADNPNAVCIEGVCNDGGGPVDFDYAGRFSVVPKIGYACHFADLEIVNADIDRLEFVEEGANLRAFGRAGRAERGVWAQVEWCTDDARQECVGGHTNDGRFNLQRVYPGDCAEVWTLVGQFDDADNWSATVRLTFQGFTCAFTSCTNQSWEVTGRRQ